MRSSTRWASRPWASSSGCHSRACTGWLRSSIPPCRTSSPRSAPWEPSSSSCMPSSSRRTCCERCPAAGRWHWAAGRFRSRSWRSRSSSAPRCSRGPERCDRSRSSPVPRCGALAPSSSQPVAPTPSRSWRSPTTPCHGSSIVPGAPGCSTASCCGPPLAERSSVDSRSCSAASRRAR